MTTDQAVKPWALPLLATKLHRPRPAAPLAPRPRLIEALTVGLSRKLTLISAPAGYGKTTVVNQWLDAVGRPSAWVSLDEHDSDLATFISYLLAAVRSVYPGAGHTSEFLLRAPQLPAPDRLADSLLHDLLTLPGPLILVLDDYHSIHNLAVHTMVERLVQHLPAHVHLVLTTRADPPWSMERLRGRQQLAEVRSTDLRFTQEEASQLLQQLLGAKATDELAILLEESTEGWAVGLQLAAITLRQRPDPVAFARRLAASSNQLVTDYLLIEVLEGLPESQRTALLQTSLLDRFCAPLCNALWDGASQELTGESFLRATRRANLFLSPLDDEGTWFRYHQLFRRILRNRLGQIYSEAEVKQLHARASAWFAAHELYHEAIDHAVQAGDVVGAATLVEERVHPLLEREHWREVEHLLGLLPAAVLTRPQLQIAQAWLLFIRSQFPAIAALVDALEAASASDLTVTHATAATLRGEICVLRAAIAYHQSDMQSTVRLAAAAAQQLRPELQYALGQAYFYYVSGLQAAGESGTAVEFAQRQLEAAYARQAHSLAMRLLLALASVHYEQAELSALQTVAATIAQVADQVGFGLSGAWAQCILGWVHYQRNELAAAEHCFRNVAAVAQAVHGRALLDGFAGLVLTALAQQRQSAALAAIAMLRAQLLARGMMAFAPLADSLQQRVALVYTPALAAGWRHDGLQTTFPPAFWEQPVLTLVRTLLARGTPADLARAAALLTDCRTKAAALYSARRLIEVGALETLVFAAQGDDAAALAALRQAVLCAAPGGALQLLAECGPGLIAPLRKLQTEGVAPGYVQQVLALLETAAPPTPVQQNQATSAAAPGVGLADLPLLVEALTNREIDVLILLAQRFSNKEIAARLFLAPTTVKKHTINIYQKLGVDSRRAAVAQAQRLGIL